MLLPEVAEQLSTLDVIEGRPLIVTDADEVLFLFMADFESWLQSLGYRFDWSSYALAGNIRERASDRPIGQDEVRPLLDGYFVDRTSHVPPVPGAAEGLARLAQRAQIVVLSNLPLAQRSERAARLAAVGMAYPLVANSGAKGPAVAALAARARAPVVFLDDSPLNIASVRKRLADAWCIHFVADPRLARLSGPAPEGDVHLGDWPAAVDWIEARLAAAGH